MNTPVIEATGLTKTFGTGHARVTAVDDIDLRIDAGEVIGFLGPNGAGKSTTIDLLLGLTRPSAGTVRIFGTSPREAVAAGRIGAVLQTGGLLPRMSVRDTVAMIAATHRNPLPVEDVLEQADLTSLAARRVGQCSGGEQQRLRFALAILSDPDLLVLDEPTAGMDAGARHGFWAAMHAQARRGRTILFSTHYIEEAQDFAERIVMIARGRILADGPTAEIRERAAARTVSAVLPAGLDPASLPGVSAAEPDGHRTVLRTGDSDVLARYLLSETAARDVEISPASLESAFLALTSDPADTF